MLFRSICLVPFRQYPFLTIHLHYFIRCEFFHIHERQGGETGENKQIPHQYEAGRIILYGLAAILIVTGARSAYSFGHGIFYAPAMEEEPGTVKSVRLDGDESVEEVGKILKKAGLIRDPRAFTLQAKCYGYEVKAGTYELNTSKDSKELIDILKEDQDDTAKEDTKS